VNVTTVNIKIIFTLVYYKCVILEKYLVPQYFANKIKLVLIMVQKPSHLSHKSEENLKKICLVLNCMKKHLMFPFIIHGFMVHGW